MDDASANIERGNPPEVSYQEVSERIERWVDKHMAEAEQSLQSKQPSGEYTSRRSRINELLGITDENHIDLGKWKAPSGKDYSIDIIKDAKDPHILFEAQTNSKDDPNESESFLYHNGEGEQYLVYKREKEMPSWIPRVVTIEYGAHFLKADGKDEYPNSKKVNVFDKFNALVSDLELARREGDK